LAFVGVLHQQILSFKYYNCKFWIDIVEWKM
jgi:hypothetical protein